MKDKFIEGLFARLNQVKTTAGDIAENVENKKTDKGKRYISIDDLIYMVDNIDYCIEQASKSLMPKTKFLYVEDGSVELDLLERSLLETNPEIKVITYRQGSAPPILSCEDKRRGL